jgi:hypothetical protein
MEPGLGRGIWPPGLPRLESTLEGVLGAVLGRLAIAEHRDERSQDPPVGVPVEALEIRLGTGLILRNAFRLIA